MKTNVRLKRIKSLENIGVQFTKNEQERSNAVILNFTSFLGTLVSTIISLVYLFSEEYEAALLSSTGIVISLLGIYFNRKGKFQITIFIIGFTTAAVMPIHVYSAGNTGSILYLLTGIVIFSFLRYKNQLLKYLLILLFIISFFTCIFVVKTFHNDRLLIDDNMLLFYINAVTSIFAIALAISFISSSIKKQQKKLEELNLVKDKLLSVISHDLRGPLNNLIGLIEMQENGRLNEENSKGYFNKLNLEIRATANMLDDVLIWSKGQYKGIKAKKVRFNFKDIAISVVNGISVKAQEKGVSVKIIEKDIDVFADKDMIHLALRNIVGNAMKFTNREKGVIEITFERNGAFGLCRIKDNGKGLTDADLTRFKNKISFTTTGTAKEKGTGLGLILTQEFLGHNNSTLEARNNAKEGAEFTLKVPLFK